MASYDYNKLVSLLKKKGNEEMGHSAAASELGLTTGQISSMAFQQALVDSGRLDEQPRATNKQIRAMKDGGDRWEKIAAVTGKSVAAVKEAYEDAGGDLASVTRSGGGSSNGVKVTTGRGKSKTKTAAKSKTKTAGSKTKASSAKPARRARTLAERRAARAGNPS
jgi:hypothetical protein